MQCVKYGEIEGELLFTYEITAGEDECFMSGAEIISSYTSQFFNNAF